MRPQREAAERRRGSRSASRTKGKDGFNEAAARKLRKDRTATTFELFDVYGLQ